MSKINLFDFQRGSLVDGPGVRTTVFFKGCNLHCDWCHNPESRSPDRQMMFYANRCVGCGMCRAVCGNNAVRDDFTVDAEKCVLCGACAEICHPEAKVICGDIADTDEVFAKINRDIRFFRDSGGGVTFSGGECMLQPDPLLELLKKCKKSGIHTAVDTAGNVPFSRFDAVLPYTDLFLYDLKHVDDERHRAGTGVSNRLILQNLETLLEICPDRVVIRVPVIPGFNADEESIRSIAAWINGRSRPSGIEPLNYHAMGVPKAKALGDAVTDTKPLSDERFGYYKKILLDKKEEKTI